MTQIKQGKLFGVPYKKIGIGDLINFDKRGLNGLIGVLTIFYVILFGIALYNFFMHGHHAYNVTREHPWGILIATYAFFVISSIGMFFVAMLGIIFDKEAYKPISTRALVGAIALISAGFSVVVFEVGHPFRMILYQLASPGFTSAIWWDVTLFAPYLGMAILLLFLDLSGKSAWLRPLALLALVFAAIGLSNLGGLFGLLNARVFTNGLFAPVSFILTGIIGSIFLTIILLELHYKHHFPQKIKPVMDGMTKILGILIVAAILLTAWKYITSVFGGMPGRAEVATLILGSWITWVEFSLVFLLPLLAVIWGHGKETTVLFWASVGGMVGLFLMRYNLVHFTQVKPLQMMKIREYQLPPSWIEYTPSATEWMFAIGAFGIAMLIYYTLGKIFDLDHNAH